ncbi:YopJ family type III secretion system effector XopJ [Undibacterium sp.]|uniref:YopJ family type III secretion system effector XopJ n=1 Tax=Undibacterium sp. TaxID=1914977 RepID=UPI002D0390E5|nr:YopJ family type III secretion system effector XopJ [Undibacterium sp.]HTD02791.1 YopJ family type III secretion system effector XopJ [Undibacterium sp.]
MGLCISKPRTGGAEYEKSGDSERAASESSAAGSPARRPSSYHLENLPKRARGKARALEDSVKNSSVANTHPQLAAYADAVLRAASSDGVNPEISAHDVQNLEALADTYNARHPNLKLQCFASPEAFLRKLYTSDEPAWRALFRLSNEKTHRIAADIRTHPDGEKTVLLLESALSHTWDQNKGQHVFISGFQSLQRNVDTHFNNCKMAVIDVEAQKSKIGCMMFSLNFALNAYQKDDFFNNLHGRLNENGRCFDGHESQIIGEMEYIEGTKMLPAVFYKHAQSRGTMDEVVANQPDLRDRNVSTSRSSPHETLQDRVQNFRITRGELSYSMSIEASRMRKIRKAIEDS